MSIENYLKSKKILIERELKELISSFKDEFAKKSIFQPIKDFLFRGGKRWRAILSILTCQMVKGNWRNFKKLFLIPEVIHNGTLIIDDIEDNSQLRRNKPALHLEFGIDLSLNAGNFLYFLPFEILKKSKIPQEKKAKIYELIFEKMLELHFGQGMDIFWHKNPQFVSEEDYFKMARAKTGVLSSLAGKLGVILGDGSKSQEKVVENFGKELGVSFQIIDDILNLFPKSLKWGKELGEDITEGKLSLLIIKTLEAANLKDRNKLLFILRKHSNDPEIIKEAIELIKKYKAKEYAERKAREILEKALIKLKLFFPQKGVKKLEEFSKFLIERKL